MLDPVSPAVERVKDILFRPFDLVRWLVIGFTAWLATLGEGAGGGRIGGGGRNQGWGGGAQNFNDFWNESMSWMHANLGWVVLAAIGFLLVALVIGLLITWLSSRGQFMFLHNVASGRAEVVAPWHTHAAGADSLFLFRIVIGLCGFCVIVPLLVLGAWPLIGMLRNEQVAPVPLLLTIGGFGLTFLVGMGFFLVGKLTRDFVVPIMLLRGSGCRAAWGEFAGLLVGNLAAFVLYLLFHVALSIAISIAILLGMLICCVACCVLAVPYLGTVLLLPFFVFLRSYSALFLAQFGPEYDVFGGAPGAPVSA